MADTDQDQKTEQPTGKHIDEAHQRGQFAKAHELQVLATLTAVLAVLAFTARSSGDRVDEYAVSIFTGFTKMSIHQDTAASQMTDLALAVAPVILPALLACAVAAIVVGGIQSGFKLTPKAIGFSLERLDPAAGFRRVFSKSVFAKVAIDSLKVAGIGAALAFGARKLLGDPLFTMPIEAAYLGRFMNQAAIELFGRMLLALAIAAAISYLYERFKTNRELMMTRQEVKDEQKQNEVDAQLKAAQRRLARRLMQRQMLEAVATADVIVTNPTHYAVALKYERKRDKAPVVLAKGENRFARRIKDLGAEHGVPCVENKPVARLLFALGRVGESIPPELYQAVAEILAMVYRTHRYYFYRLRARRVEASA